MRRHNSETGHPNPASKPLSCAMSASSRDPACATTRPIGDHSDLLSAPCVEGGRTVGAELP